MPADALRRSLIDIVEMSHHQFDYLDTMGVAAMMATSLQMMTQLAKRFIHLFNRRDGVARPNASGRGPQRMPQFKI